MRILIVVAAVAVLSAGLAQAQKCTVTVTAPDSIQNAVNAAKTGAVICLDGTFYQSVSINKSHLTLRAAPGKAAVLDGTGAAPDAIILGNNVSQVTIEGLEIRNYGMGQWCCGYGNAIVAWDVSTSSIAVRKNHLHDNNWNGVLVGSEGAQIHKGWTIEQNIVAKNGYAQIEITNCDSCSIQDNTVVGNTSTYTDPFWYPTTLGILVQARNMVPGAPPVEIQAAKVQGNQISGCEGGGWFDVCLYLYAQGLSEGPQVSRAILKPVSVVQNKIAGRRGVYVLGVAVDGAGFEVSGVTAGQVVNASVVNNAIQCAGSPPLPSAAVVADINAVNTKIVNNAIAPGCTYNVADFGQKTKIPRARSKR